MKPGFTCGGPTACRESRVRPISHLFNDNNDIIGSGEVCPSISFFQGRLLPPEMVMVRFSSTDHDSGHEITGKFRVWHLARVS